MISKSKGKGKGKGKSKGKGKGKGESKHQYRSLSTTLRFGRADERGRRITCDRARLGSEIVVFGGGGVDVGVDVAYYVCQVVELAAEGLDFGFGAAVYFEV